DDERWEIAAPPDVEPALDAPRVASIVEQIADRKECALELSRVLRDPSATGAERVAASREIRAIIKDDRGEHEATAAGPPPPVSRTEQVVSLVRILCAAGPDVRLKALEIVAERFTTQRARILELIPRLSGNVTLPTEGAPHGEAASSEPRSGSTSTPTSQAG